MVDGSLDISGIKIAVPGGYPYSTDTCKTSADLKKNEACKAFVDFASASYFDVVGQLKKITKLKDVCPDVRLPKPTLSNFYPGNVAETFARLTECRQRLANSVFSNSPSPLPSSLQAPSVSQVATPQCLKIELKELKTSYTSYRFQLPVGGVNRDCFEVVVPASKGKRRMLEVRLPDGWKVFLSTGPNFIPRTMDGDLRPHRLVDMNASEKNLKTFLIFVSNKNEGAENSEIPVIFTSSKLP